MKKKKQRQLDNPPKEPQFRSTPFSGLKEMTVALAPEQTVVPDPAPKPLASALEESSLFLLAMEGVRQLKAAPQSKKVSEPARKSIPELVKAEQIKSEHLEKEAFTQAISQLKLDVTFSDGFEGDEELKPLAFNRLRQIKKGVINVNRQLDLHGLTRDEALAALPSFLTNARHHGEKAVLVITGKGNNSPAEPVLHQAVAGWLREQAKELVVEFAPAPREMGGSGAYVVFLRSTAKTLL